MKKSNVFIILILFSKICISQKNVKFRGMEHELQSTILSNDQHLSLKNYIQKITGSAPKDTLCIWYHYNHTKCWQNWDYMHTEKEAIDWANYMNNQFQKYLLQHKKTTIVQARALGNNANKVVSVNKNVVYDYDNVIQKLFFKEPKNCSSSVIIYPDKTCLIIHDDPHYDFLYASKKLLF